MSRSEPGGEAWSIVVGIVKAAHRRNLAELDLTMAQAQLLLNLDATRPVPMNEIANLLGCDASNVTGLVDRLEARKFIARQADSDDRRVKNIAVTRAGASVQDRLRAKWYDPPAPIAALSAADKKTFLAIMQRAEKHAAEG